SPASASFHHTWDLIPLASEAGSGVQPLTPVGGDTVTVLVLTSSASRSRSPACPVPGTSTDGAFAADNAPAPPVYRMVDREGSETSIVPTAWPVAAASSVTVRVQLYAPAVA